MANNLTDGTLDFGSKTVTVTPEDGGDDFTVILDSITPNYPTKVVERTNQLDEPTAQRIYKTWVTGSAVAQTNGEHIATLDQFPCDLGYGSENFIVTGVSPAYQKDGETKQNIEFRKRLSALS